MPQSGVHSITVPGAVAGWSLLLERFGRMPLARVLAPAIALADEGFPVAEITSEEWHNQDVVSARRSRSRDARLPSRRAPARVRRDLPQCRPGVDLSPDCRARQRRRSIAATLRAGWSRGSSGAARRWPRRPRGVPRAVGRSDFDDLSGLGRLRAAAERRRHRGADDAEHHGVVSRSRERPAHNSVGCAARR